MHIHFSPDGIHWGDEVAKTGPCGDRNSAFGNPFRRRWVFSIREYRPFGGIGHAMRCRRYWESPDLIAGLPWEYGEPPLWVAADRLDVGSEQPSLNRNCTTLMPSLTRVCYLACSPSSAMSLTRRPGGPRRTRSVLVLAGTVFIGTVRTGVRSCRFPNVATTGTGAMFSQWAAAVP